MAFAEALVGIRCFGLRSGMRRTVERPTYRGNIVFTPASFDPVLETSWSRLRRQRDPECDQQLVQRLTFGDCPNDDQLSDAF